MAFFIPDSKITPADRLGYCAAAMEKLRRHHNEQSAVLKPDDMRRWIKGSFQPYSLGICRELLKCRAEVEADQTLAGQAKALQVTSGKLVYPPGLDRWQDRYALLWVASRGAKPDQEPTERDSHIGEALGAHKFAPPQSALDEIVLPALDARGEVLDPYEDYTTYTEYDPPGYYTVVNSTNITAANVNWDDAYIYSDKGAGHFGSTFTHLVEAEFNNPQSSSWVAPWVVANSLNDTWDLRTTKALDVHLRCVSAGSSYLIQIRDLEDDSYDEWISAANLTWYYLEIDRNAGTATCYIRTGSHGGILQDTITTSLNSANTFRYIFAINNFHAAGTNNWHGYVRNLDLQEAAAGAFFPWHRRKQNSLIGR